LQLHLLMQFGTLSIIGALAVSTWHSVYHFTKKWLEKNCSKNNPNHLRSMHSCSTLKRHRIWYLNFSTAQLLSTSVLALKYVYELNCQEKGKFYKFISKRRIISLRHSSILRRIWLNFMALCLVFIIRLFHSFHIFFG
jgi:hypothetical protein